MKRYEDLWNEQMKRAEFHMTLAKALLFACKTTTRYLKLKRERYKELEEEKILRMKWNNELE